MLLTCTGPHVQLPTRAGRPAREGGGGGGGDGVRRDGQPALFPDRAGARRPRAPARVGRAHGGAGCEHGADRAKEVRTVGAPREDQEAQRRGAVHVLQPRRRAVVQAGRVVDEVWHDRSHP